MKTLLNRVLVTVLVLSLLLGSSAQLFATPALATNDASEEYQDMKIAVLSDLHFKAGDGAVDTAFITMMEQFKTENLDVVMITGDIGYACEEVEYEKFWAAWDTVFPDAETAPELVIVSGNHEFDRAVFGKESYGEAVERILRVFNFGEEMNQHVVVKGYHFITINSESEYTHGKFTETSTAWLKEQLDAAVAENPNMPIFVTAHQPLLNTTYGSDWDASLNKTAALYELLKDYPQVVFFAGHSHYPMENERSIYQDTFTCVDVTSMNYMSIEDGSKNYDYQGALLVTVSGADKQIVIDRYKINHGEEGDTAEKIKESWTLNLPLNPAEFTYTAARAESRVAPTFAEGSAVTVSEVAQNTAKVNFPAATHDDYVHAYNIVIKNGETVALNQTVNGDFHKPAAQQAASFSVKVSGLEAGVTYTVEVTAVESFGKASEPLVLEFTTEPPLDKTQFVDPMDNFDLIVEKSEGWQKEKNPDTQKTVISRTKNDQDVWVVWQFDGYVREFALDLVPLAGFGSTANEIEIYVSKDGADWKQLNIQLSELVADPMTAAWENVTASNTGIIGGNYNYLKLVMKPFSAGVNWAMLVDNLYVKLSEDATDAVTQPGTFMYDEDPSIYWTHFIDPMDDFNLVDGGEKPAGWQKEYNKEVEKSLFSRVDNENAISVIWKVEGYIREFAMDILSVNGGGNPAEELEFYVSKDGTTWEKLRWVMSEPIPDPGTAYWNDITITNNKCIGGDYSYLKVVMKPFAFAAWANVLDNLHIVQSNTANDSAILPGTFYGEADPSLAWNDFADPMDNWDLVVDAAKPEGWQKEYNKEVEKSLFSRADNSQDVCVTWKVDGYIRQFALDILSVNGGGNPAEELEIYVSKDGIEWRQLLTVIGEPIPDPGTAYWNDITITGTNVLAEDYSYFRVVFKPFAFAGWAIVLDNLNITYSDFTDDAEMQKGTFVVEEEHVCEFAAEWSHDETSHWHECACGAKADEAACVFGEAWQSNGTNHWHECECGNKIDNAEHVQEDLPAVEATCTETGLTKGAKCSICERTMIKQTEMPANGHSYGEWTESKAATVEAEGEEKRVCSGCGAEETRATAKLEPEPTQPTQPTDPTEPTEPADPQPTGSKTGLIVGIVIAVAAACAVVAFVLIKKRKG